MNGFITPEMFSRALDLPISLPQTELRRNKSLVVSVITLKLGQQIVLRSLTMHCIKNLTPGALPVLANSSLGIASVGLYFGETLTSPLAVAKVDRAGTAAVNPFMACKCMTPGIYSVIVSNNTTNLDLTVSATGSVKLYA